MSDNEVIIGVCDTMEEANAIVDHMRLRMHLQIASEPGYDASGKRVWYLRGPACNFQTMTVFQAGYKAGANSNA